MIKVIKAVLVITLTTLLVGCQTEEEYLKSKGYSSPEYNGTAWFACNYHTDTLASYYTVTTINNKKIDIAVCYSEFRGYYSKELNQLSDNK